MSTSERFPCVELLFSCIRFENARKVVVKLFNSWFYDTKKITVLFFSAFCFILFFKIYTIKLNEYARCKYGPERCLVLIFYATPATWFLLQAVDVGCCPGAVCVCGEVARRQPFFFDECDKSYRTVQRNLRAA